MDEPSGTTLPSCYSFLVCLMVPTHGCGNAQDLIKARIRPINRYRLPGRLWVYLMHADFRNPRWPLPSWSVVRKRMWPKIPEEERNGYIEAMKANNVPEWHRAPRKSSIFPKAHAAAYVMMALAGYYQRTTLSTLCLSPFATFDITFMGAGFRAVKRE